MELLTHFLQKFKKLDVPDRVIRESCAAHIHELLHADIAREDISFKNGVIYITAPPIIKSEVLLHKHELIARIGADTASERVSVRDIR